MGSSPVAGAASAAGVPRSGVAWFSVAAPSPFPPAGAPGVGSGAGSRLGVGAGTDGVAASVPSSGVPLAGTEGATAEPCGAVLPDGCPAASPWLFGPPAGSRSTGPDMGVGACGPGRPPCRSGTDPGVRPLPSPP
ncbi:hypothetical protein [Corynebacterium bovis]|uniref:hypothetical protein n=1 Tax=Corynebacterium bovis TaxID=36808 RepID=UPI0031387C46